MGLQAWPSCIFLNLDSHSAILCKTRVLWKTEHLDEATVSFKPHPSCCLWERGGVWSGSEHMQNRSVCISINKRTLCVCLAPVMARAVDCFRKLCSNSRISKIFKHWTRNWALKIHTQETYDSIKFWKQNEDLQTVL